MKVIDLLNKIANGEEVPKKIEYRNIKFVYDEDNRIYIVENYNKYVQRGDTKVDVPNCLVREYYYKGKWHQPQKELKVIDVLKKYEVKQ